MLAWADPGRARPPGLGAGRYRQFRGRVRRVLALGVGEDVVEVGGAQAQPRGEERPARYAARAARAAMASDHPAGPRAGGLREAIRALTLATRHAVLTSRTKAINELKSLIVVAPEHLRASWRRGRNVAGQAAVPNRGDDHPAGRPRRAPRHHVSDPAVDHDPHPVPVRAQLAELDPELRPADRQHPAGPALLAEPGVGPVVAAQMLISLAHLGRVRSEAAFAALAGVAPLEASSGQRSRHRLNRGGDRDLNRALHTIAITRLRCHPESRNYEAKRAAQGKTHRDVRRSLKRALARRLYRQMQAATAPAASTLPQTPAAA